MDGRHRRRANSRLMMEMPMERNLERAQELYRNHHDAWRSAILDKQTPFGSDDDGSYWSDTLSAFDRFMRLVCSLEFDPTGHDLSKSKNCYRIQGQ